MSHEDLDVTALGRMSRRGFLTRLGVSGGLLATGGLMAACGSDDSSSAGGSGGGGDFKNIKLGYSMPTTGPAASSFSIIFTPADIAIDELKKANGKVTFEKVVEDDKADPSVIPATFRKFRQSDISFVVGPNSSGTALAAIPIATSQKILNLGSAVANDLGNPDKAPYCWQLNGSADQEATKVIDFVIERNWTGKLGMIQADDAFGDALATSSQRILREKGIELLEVQKHASDETNLAPFVSKLKSAGVDTILVWSSLAPTIAATVKAFDNANYTPNLLGHCSWLTETTYKAGSKDVTDNIYGYFNKKFTWTDGEDIGPEQVKYAETLDQYTKGSNLGGQESVTITTPSYDFVLILAQAIEQAGSTDPLKVNEVLEGMGPVEGVLASYNFNAQSHAALDPDSMVMAKTASYADPKAKRFFRERA